MVKQKWMKRGVVMGGLALAATVFAGSIQAPAQGAAKIQWETSMATAIKKAKASKKPILLDVYASWCGPCKAMDKNTYTNASVISESKKWIMVKIDGDKDQALSQRYKVEGFPTTLFLKSNGQSVGGFAGYAGPADMLKQMKAAAPKARK